MRVKRKEKIMKNYLSIGEVVKMKGISHRALRHYDDLGILTPAYTNPDTKYRYYSKNQMVILDIIMLCVPMGIPLQHFKNYIFDDGNINTKQMIDDARIKILEKKAEIKRQLYFLDSALAHFKDVEDIADKKQVYTKHIDKRYILTTPAPKDFGTIDNYWSKLTMLYKTAMHNDFSLSIVQGLCFYLVNNTAQVKYYVEIKKPHKAHPDILILPKAKFLCEFFEDSCFFEALEKYQKHESYLAGNMFILSDILEENITHKPAPFEIQLKI